MEKKVMRVMVLAIMCLVAFLISCTPVAEQCSVDADCVPAQCCHPAGAVNKADGPDCSGVLCTMSCEGPLDCGAGEVKCVSKHCAVVALS